jgi:hypothetical protein
MKSWAGQMVRGEMRNLANMSHDARHIGFENADFENARQPAAMRASPATGVIRRGRALAVPTTSMAPAAAMHAPCPDRMRGAAA